MNYWFTSDTHFGHINIIEYCYRPFKTIEDMNNTLIKNWNKTVKYGDIVFHLGDFMFRGNNKEIIDKLNGTIILIKGNHDNHKTTIIQELIINHGGREWTLIHDPAMTISNNVLCGHVHQHWKVKRIKDRIYVNVGVDMWNYTPVSIDQILNAIQGENENGKEKKNKTEG